VNVAGTGQGGIYRDRYSDKEKEYIRNKGVIGTDNMTER
jgi:hypothetical protein